MSDASREEVVAVSNSLKTIGVRMAAEGRTIPLQQAATATCILLAKLRKAVEPDEFEAACKLMAVLLNSHSLAQMMSAPGAESTGRTVTEIVQDSAQASSST